MTITIAAKYPIQINFFEKLRSSAPPNIALASEIADILEISMDGVYRRMRGESVLGMDEMMKLCRHYQLIPDMNVNTNTQQTSFSFKKLADKNAVLEDYISNIFTEMQAIQVSSPKQIMYAANDLPVFHQFMFPNFAAFKIFLWNRTILSASTKDTMQFNLSGILPRMINPCKKIAELYTRIPSIEIWHNDIIINNIKLIEYAWDAGLFSTKDDALVVCQGLIDLLILAEKQAARCSKFIHEDKWEENKGNFTMYHCELLLSNNHIFVTKGIEKKIYLSYNTFHTMSTSDATFCNETENWLNSLIQKSLLISGSAEKQRHGFFKHGQKKVADLALKIRGI